MNGAFATKSPSGAKRAQEKSSRSLMFVLIEVCRKDRPIASATLMNLLLNSASRIGSGRLAGVWRESGGSIARGFPGEKKMVDVVEEGDQDQKFLRDMVFRTHSGLVTCFDPPRWRMITR